MDPDPEGRKTCGSGRIRIPNNGWRFQEEAFPSCDAGGGGGSGVVWTTEAEDHRGLTLMSVLPTKAGVDGWGEVSFLLFCWLENWQCVLLSSYLLLSSSCWYLIFAFYQTLVLVIQTRAELLDMDHGIKNKKVIRFLDLSGRRKG